MVSNAGIIKLSPAENYSMEDFDAVMDLNLRALFCLTRVIAKQMIVMGHDKIINTCSVQFVKGGSGDAAYAASKHAVYGLTRAWANEWGRPEDLMGPVAFLASAASNYINGHMLVADGGYLNA